MRETMTLEVILRVDGEGLAHHESSIGNTSLCMRSKQRMPDGSFVDIPTITGDSLRHQLREASAFALLDAADMLKDGVLTEPALRLLFAGGQITGASGGSVKLDDYRQMCKLIPPLELFGGCAQNRCIPGQLYVNGGVLICEETMHRMPQWVRDWVVENTRVGKARENIEEVIRVRGDPCLDPAKRKLLTTGDQVEANRRLQARETANDVEDDGAKLAEKSTMLPRSFERVVRGSLFYWSVTAVLNSELARDTFLSTVMMFLANAHVGGKRATGHGNMSVAYGKDGKAAARQMTLTRPRDAAEDIQPEALAPKLGGLLKAHVAQNRDEVVKFLSTVLA